MIGFTGDECNRVGIGYTAFQTQGDKCGQPQGSCLKNQIKDLLQEDTDRLSQGLTTKYLLGGFFNLSSVALTQSASSGGKFLRYDYPYIQTTLLTLEIQADDS